MSRGAAEENSARTDPRPGYLAALLVLAIYGGFALAVDVPRAAMGFQSDEATYYLMGYSLAEDGDLTYRREDLTRVWREFRSGPSGVFLKRGRDVSGVELTGTPPFVGLRSAPDPDATRLFYGKSFVYPLIAAPLVAMFGTNGFLLLNALCLAVVVLVGYLFLNAQSRPLVAVTLAAGYVMASVAPAYFAWITPELLNFAAVTVAYFFWLYKEVAQASSPGESGGEGWRGLRAWVLGPRSDSLAAIALAVATCSKPSNILLIGPILLWQAWRRQYARAFITGSLFAGLVATFFLVNVAIAGDWNFQGGERRTYYAAYPFQTSDAGFDVGLDRATNRVLTEVIFDRSVFWTVLWHNAGYFFVGRYSGLLPYFFPVVFALVAFALARGRRTLWQYLVLAAALAEILLLIIWIPYNYFGGGGVLGNRYFMSIYGLFLFLIPPIESVAAVVFPWLVGGLFTAQIVINPFFSSFFPAEHAKRGPLRLLPVELSLVNDLPINTNIARVRVPFGEALRFQLYFLDDNSYPREGNSFWVKGESTAEFLVKAGEPVRTLILGLETGGVANRVTVRAAGTSETVDIPASQKRQITLPLDEGFPYQGTRVWTVSVRSETGFVPMFTAGGSDSRYLGIFVTPELK